MLRKMSLLAVSTLALTVAANAADLYGYKDAPYAPPEPWTGLYIGAHVGTVDGDVGVTDLGHLGPTSTNSFSTSAAAFGGGTAGFNFQRGAFVFGVEGDAGYMGLSGTHSLSTSPTVGSLSHDIDPGLYADFTGRLGYTAGRFLIYGKAGLAFYNGEGQTNGIGAPYAPYPAVSNDGFAEVSKARFLGYTAGGGLEYALNPLVSLKVEYLHFDFGTEDSTLRQYSYTWAPPVAPAPLPALVSATTSSWRFEHSLTADSVKFGVNFHVQLPEPMPLK